MPFSTRNIPIIGNLSEIAKIAAVSALVGLAAYGAGFIHGRYDGAAVAEGKSIQSTFDQLNERGLINEDVRNADDCDLLSDLGVVCDQ